LATTFNDDHHPAMGPQIAPCTSVLKPSEMKPAAHTTCGKTDLNGFGANARG
jgi:hypothetical protein